jgi:hypothetical protein
MGDQGDYDRSQGMEEAAVKNHGQHDPIHNQVNRDPV